MVKEVVTLAKEVVTAAKVVAEDPPQKHLAWTMPGPDSSYSALVIHICWKVLNEERMEPPIQTEYLRSGGAIILTSMVEGAKFTSSCSSLSTMPSNIVLPPDITTF